MNLFDSIPSRDHSKISYLLSCGRATALANFADLAHSYRSQSLAQGIADGERQELLVAADVLDAFFDASAHLSDDESFERAATVFGDSASPAPAPAPAALIRAVRARTGGVVADGERVHRPMMAMDSAHRVLFKDAGR